MLYEEGEKFKSEKNFVLWESFISNTVKHLTKTLHNYIESEVKLCGIGAMTAY